MEVHSDHTAYQQYDPPTASLRRDSAELFVKEVIPSLKITQVRKLLVTHATKKNNYTSIAIFL